MAKKAMVNKNERRKKMKNRYAAKRAALRAVLKDPEAPMEEKVAAMMKMAKLPPNSRSTRVRNRCVLTGRPRGYHRKFGISRVALRELASVGELPGVTKSSW